MRNYIAAGSVVATLMLALAPAAAAFSRSKPRGDALVMRVNDQFKCSQVKDPDLAIQGCLALVQADPNNALALLSLSLAYERTGQTGEALGAFLGVANLGYQRTEANPNDGEAWVLIYQGSTGAARIAKDEPDMRKDFEASAKKARQRATALGMKVFD